MSEYGYNEKDRKHDEAIFQLSLLRVLYNSGTIDETIFKQAKRYLGKGVENWSISESFFNNLKRKHNKTRGRIRKELPHIEQIFGQVDAGEMSVTHACRLLEIGRSTYYRRYREWIKNSQ